MRIKGEYSLGEHYFHFKYIDGVWNDDREDYTGGAWVLDNESRTTLDIARVIANNARYVIHFKDKPDCFFEKLSLVIETGLNKKKIDSSLEQFLETNHINLYLNEQISSPEYKKSLILQLQGKPYKCYMPRCVTVHVTLLYEEYT
jgi:hypothetical protein